LTLLTKLMAERSHTLLQPQQLLLLECQRAVKRLNSIL
jgi:hypothetical protein